MTDRIVGAGAAAKLSTVFVSAPSTKICARPWCGPRIVCHWTPLPTNANVAVDPARSLTATEPPEAAAAFARPHDS